MVAGDSGAGVERLHWRLLGFGGVCLFCDCRTYSYGSVAYQTRDVRLLVNVIVPVNLTISHQPGSCRSVRIG